MTLDVAQIWIGIFGAAAIFFVNHRNPRLQRWGSVMGLISQPAWFYATWSAGQWGIFLLSLFYTWSWAMGAYNHWWRRRGPLGLR